MLNRLKKSANDQIKTELRNKTKYLLPRVLSLFKIMKINTADTIELSNNGI